MWSATIIQKEVFGASLRLTIEFSNGTRSFTEVIIIASGDDLNSVLTERINNLNNLDNQISAVNLGAYTPVQLAPQPVVGVTDVIAKDPRIDFRDSLNLFRSYQRAVADGFVTSSDPGYVSARQTVVNALTSDLISLF